MRQPDIWKNINGARKGSLIIKKILINFERESTISVHILLFLHNVKFSYVKLIESDLNSL